MRIYAPKAKIFLHQTWAYEQESERLRKLGFSDQHEMLEKIVESYQNKKHSGIIAKFREFYLKTDLFNKEFSDSISSLFRVRTASDYDDFYVVSKNDATAQYENYLSIKWN